MIEAAVLSVVQRNVLERIRRGDGNRQIADAMHMSISTVKAQVALIKQKLGVPNRTAAAYRKPQVPR